MTKRGIVKPLGIFSSQQLEVRATWEGLCDWPQLDCVTLGWKR